MSCHNLLSIWNDETETFGECAESALQTGLDSAPYQSDTIR